MFANVCAGFICSCHVELWDWHFLGFGFSSVSCVYGVLVPLLYTRLGLLWCAPCWTRPSGGGRWRHYLCNLWGECLAAQKIAYQFFELFQVSGNFMHHKSYVLALAGQPSLHGYDACMIYWTKGAVLGNRRQKYCKTSFSPFWVFLLSRNSRVHFWGLVLRHLWTGRARHPGPPPPDQFSGLEVFNVGVG